MDDLVKGVDCLEVIDNDAKPMTDEHPEASVSSEVCEDNDSVSKYSYLGRVLPALIVQHQDWGIPQFYESLSSRKDFPIDGSVTKANLRKRVTKLRKKLKSNGGFLLNPYDNKRQLRAEPHNEKSENDDECDDATNSPNPKAAEVFSLKTALELATTMSHMWCGLSYSSMVKVKGLVEGAALWIQQMSTYITMLRGSDGKEAARLFLSAVLWDKDAIISVFPELVHDKLFSPLKSSVGITNEDKEIWEAMNTNDSKEAKLILERLVESDKEQVKSGKRMGKSLPYLQLASIYLNGKGVKRDFKRAEDLYGIAAERGNSIAQHKVAYLAEQRGVKGKRLVDMYRIGVENENADSVNNLVVELLNQPGNTFSNNEEIRDLLNWGVKLNTSSHCKETYLKEMMTCKSAGPTVVLQNAWELIVAGESPRAGFFAGSQYLLQENKGLYNLKLADALLRLGADKGCDISQQYLPRVKALRMQEEGSRYRSKIPPDYVQKREEWEEAKERMVDDLSEKFLELLIDRLEECFAETSQLRE